MAARLLLISATPRPIPHQHWTGGVRRMVGRVLTGNGITEVQQGRYRLIGGGEPSDTQRDELLQLCPSGWTLFAARSAVR